MKKQIIGAVLVCGACFALCSCGKNKATTFTTDDIDTFVNSENGNTGSPESPSPYNYDDDSDLIGVESERESNDRAAVDSVASAFCATVASLRVSDINDVTYDQMDSAVLQEMENYLGKTIQEVESEFESNACKGKRLHFYFYNSYSSVKVGVGSLDGTLNQNNEFDFYYPV